MRVIWRWKDDGTTIQIASESFNDDINHPPRAGIVRGFTTVLTELKRLDPVGDVPQTRLTYVQQVNVGGCECASARKNFLHLSLTLSLSLQPSPKAS